MSDMAYQLNTLGGLIGHFPGQPLLVRDSEDLESSMLSDARVRSGDYFMTLATELDKLAQGLVAADAPEAPQLEELVSELLYLHKRYHITKKS